MAQNTVFEILKISVYVYNLYKNFKNITIKINYIFKFISQKIFIRFIFSCSFYILFFLQFYLHKYNLYKKQEMRLKCNENLKALKV